MSGILVWRGLKYLGGKAGFVAGFGAAAGGFS
jgi:hypothetical protein